MKPTRFGLKGAAFYVALACTFLASPYSNLFASRGGVQSTMRRARQRTGGLGNLA